MNVIILKMTILQYCFVHNIHKHMLELLTGGSAGKATKEKCLLFSLFSCQQKDFSSAAETNTRKLKRQSCLAKCHLDSLILKDISMSYTPPSPPTLYLNPPQPHCIAPSHRELPAIPAQLLIK